MQAELTIFFRDIIFTKIFVKLISRKFQPFLWGIYGQFCLHIFLNIKCLLVTTVISEFLAWLLFLKTRLCKEKKATRTFICWVFVATKKNIKTTKKISQKNKNKQNTKKFIQNILTREKNIFFLPLLSIKNNNWKKWEQFCTTL